MDSTAGDFGKPGRALSSAITRAKQGDREAVGFLYARFADDIHGYVCSIVHDPHEAEDITQHVFAKLIHAIGKYEEREVPFNAWMLRVARNAALDHLRRQRAIPVEEVHLRERHATGATGAERISALRDALAELPHDQREVLVLRHFAGLSPGEIAQRIGRSEGSVHGLHHRARRTLTSELTSRGAAPSTIRSLRPRAGLAGQPGAFSPIWDSSVAPPSESSATARG
jgi:RNA polymerase sigma-70 factor, ECF subfamily